MKFNNTQHTNKLKNFIPKLKSCMFLVLSKKIERKLKLCLLLNNKTIYYNNKICYIEFSSTLRDNIIKINDECDIWYENEDLDDILYVKNIIK